MRSKVEVRAVCPGCGPMIVSAAVCLTTILVPAVAPAVETLWSAGAGHISGIVPFELLETHAGPPLSWDDVLDFKLALENRSCFLPQAGV
jgi:hypothetical protein